LIIEEALEEVSVSIEEWAEGQHVLAVWQGLDIGPCAQFIAALPQLVAVIGAVGQKGSAPPKTPALRHLLKRVHAGGVRAVALRNISPRRANPQPPEYPVSHGPVIQPRDAARLVRQQGLNHWPLEIRQIKTRHINLHDLKSESSSCRFGNPFYEFMI